MLPSTILVVWLTFFEAFVYTIIGFPLLVVSQVAVFSAPAFSCERLMEKKLLQCTLNFMRLRRLHCSANNIAMIHKKPGDCNRIEESILCDFNSSSVSLYCLSLCLSVCLSVSLSLSLSLSLSVSLSLSLSFSLSVSLSLSLSLSPSVCLSPSLSLSPSLCISVSVCLSVCLSPSLPLSLFVCFCLSVCLSVSLVFNLIFQVSTFGQQLR